jgi:hypothetical protein
VSLEGSECGYQQRTLRRCYRHLERIGTANPAQGECERQPGNEQKAGTAARHTGNEAGGRAGAEAKQPVHVYLREEIVMNMKQKMFHMKSVITDQ